MRIIPQSRRAQIELFEILAAAWAEDPASIGLDAAQVAGLSAAAAEARAAYEEARAARAAAESATLRFHTASGLLRARGGGLIATVKAFAGLSGDGNVYARAKLPPPPAPGTGSPPAPTRPAVRFELLTDGAVRLRWRARHAGASRGVRFLVHRRDGGAAEPYRLIGVTGAKAYTDRHLPPGATGATYIVTAVRDAVGGTGGGQARGVPSGPVVVRFGTEEAPPTPSTLHAAA